MKLGPNQLALLNLWRTTISNQVTGQLCAGNDYYCCLGLATDLVFPDEWVEMVHDDFDMPIWSQDGEGMVMPQEVTHHYGFHTNDGSPVELDDGFEDLASCAVMNDEWGYTFSEIADVVQANPDAYFKESK